MVGGWNAFSVTMESRQTRRVKIGGEIVESKYENEPENHPRDGLNANE